VHNNIIKIGNMSTAANDGLTTLLEYFIKTGLIVFSVRKAPCLNGMIEVPLEVAPSGKIRNGLNSPVSSISYYRVRIASIA